MMISFFSISYAFLHLSVKPTTNGERCILPHKIGTYTWDSYFCNNGFCPTSTNSNIRCTPGKFGHFNFGAPPQTLTFMLNTDTNGINGTNQQCLIYYYYLSNIPGTQLNIRVRIQEPSGNNEEIDVVTNAPYNGWIRRLVSFSTMEPGYKVIISIGT